MEAVLASKRIPVSIEDEVRQSYMDYAMSVIVGRALPDARDGLKPVHRRVLYAMHDLGNEWNRAYKKSARVVGDVIGKYHPHGDVAVYDTMVRMAQEFSLRYPLVDGQGNFGSIDGDPPAAMRYTEVRMARIASEVLADLEKETVDFAPNYDETLKEPLVLPARIPNLLVNGSGGIAVGMATNIPPHNLGEVIDALVALIENPEISVIDLMQYIPGPDFPTAGFIHGKAPIHEAYTTGRGILHMRARTSTETHPRSGRESIIVEELPYQVNKARLIERIAALVHEKKIEGISDLRDESDRHGMRIVIELKKDAVSDVVLNQLFKQTSLQESFGIIMLAIVDGRPKLLTLKDALEVFVAHRREVVTRRTVYDLGKAEARLHILEGLCIALDHLDQVITLIREANDPITAKTGLIEQFSLSERQAQAILDMRLQRLTGLERDKIVDEHTTVVAQVSRYKEILADVTEIDAIIRTELLEVKEQHDNPRRTEIIEASGDISIEDLIAEEDMVVTISHEGYIKRSAVSLYRAQRRGGRGRTGVSMKEEDFVQHLFVASTHSYILFFTTVGKVYWKKVYELPQVGPAARGKAIVNLLELSPGEKVSTFLSVREFEADRYIAFATRKGTVKKTALEAFSNPRKAGIIAISLDDDDALIDVRLTDGEQDIILSTAAGKAIRFNENDVRAMGRNAAGVRGVSLEGDNVVIGLDVVTPDATLLVVSERGYGKRSAMDEYRIQSRGGKGIFTMKVTEKTGALVGVCMVTDDEDIMLVTEGGKVIRTPVRGISVIGRNTQGVRLIGLEGEERVVGLARLAEKEDEGEEEGEHVAQEEQAPPADA